MADQNGEVVLVVRDLGTRTFGGAILRNRAMAAAIASVSPASTVIEILAVRAMAGCESQCRQCARISVDGCGTGAPDPYAWSYCQRACAHLRELLRHRDVAGVLVSELQLHQYFRAALNAGVRNVGLDMHNAEAELHQQIAAHPQAAALGITVPAADAIQAIERYVAAAAKLVTFASGHDEARFTARSLPAATAIIPNAVNAGLPDPPWQAVSPDLLFLGHLGYFPNVEAALFLVDEIFPRIRTAMPAATLTVAGRRPHASLLRRENTPGVHIAADPAETASLLPGRIMVVPLRLGGGSRLKILEAFAAGTPVISTAKGTEGLAALPDSHYLEADNNPESYLDRLRRLMEHPQEDARRRAAAFDLVRTNYSWTALHDPVSRAITILTR